MDEPIRSHATELHLVFVKAAGHQDPEARVNRATGVNELINGHRQSAVVGNQESGSLFVALQSGQGIRSQIERSHHIAKRFQQTGV